MITFAARLKALPHKEIEAASHLKEMVAAVKANEPEALMYICHTVVGSRGEFLFYEVYADEDAKDTHMQTPHFEKLKSLIGPVFDPAFGVKVEDLVRVAGVVRA